MIKDYILILLVSALLYIGFMVFFWKNVIFPMFDLFEYENEEEE